MSKSILYDATMCIDCKPCEQACATHAGLPYDDKIAAEEYQSAHKFTAVLNKERQVHAPPVHALPGTGMRVGLPGRRVAEDRHSGR